MVRLDHRRPTRRQTGAVGSNQSWISTIIVICKSEFSGKIGVVNRVSVFIKRAEISHVHALAPDQTLCPTLEVLSQLPEATQHFLLHTSIAERLCAALCDAILSEGGAGIGNPVSPLRNKFSKHSNAPTSSSSHWMTNGAGIVITIFLPICCANVCTAVTHNWKRSCTGAPRPGLRKTS